MSFLSKYIFPNVCLHLCVLALFVAASISVAQDEEPRISFTFSIHSTLGLLNMEATTEVTEESTVSVKFRVPNRGFSSVHRYTGNGSFAYRLVNNEGDAGPSSSITAPMDWNGRHVFFFAFGNPGGEVPVRLAPMPENPNFRDRGAIIFGNYSQTPMAARLGTHEVRTMPGNTIWNSAIEAPDGMQTLIVKSEDGEIRPIYRNLIPVRENQRLFIMIVPGRNEKSERLIVVFDNVR
jgi:hypothetical protein